MSHRLYIFDLDGTLAKTWEATILSGVVDRVSALKSHLAVATNQAGGGMARGGGGAVSTADRGGAAVGGSRGCGRGGGGGLR